MLRHEMRYYQKKKTQMKNKHTEEYEIELLIALHWSGVEIYGCVCLCIYNHYMLSIYINIALFVTFCTNILNAIDIHEIQILPCLCVCMFTCCFVCI